MRAAGMMVGLPLGYTVLNVGVSMGFTLLNVGVSMGSTLLNVGVSMGSTLLNVRPRGHVRPLRMQMIVGEL